MKHKTWFRLVLKAMGVLLIGFAMPELAAVLIYFLFLEGPGSPSWAANWTYAMISPAFQTAIGSYLLLDGRQILDRCIPSNRPYCPECGYDLSQSAGAKVCSECGTALPNQTSNDATGS